MLRTKQIQGTREKKIDHDNRGHGTQEDGINESNPAYIKDLGQKADETESSAIDTSLKGAEAETTESPSYTLSKDDADSKDDKTDQGNQDDSGPSVFDTFDTYKADPSENNKDWTKEVDNDTSSKEDYLDASNEDLDEDIFDSTDNDNDQDDIENSENYDSLSEDKGGGHDPSAHGI